MSRGLAKRNGDALEADQIAQEETLVGVSDDEAEWHDARTIAVLSPHESLQFGSTCLLERGTAVEVKAAHLLIKRSGSWRGPGVWYIKQRAHERILEAAGAYLLVVYQNGEADDTDHLDVLRRIVIPASIVDELIQSWSNAGDDRDERAVARVAWDRVFDRDELLQESQEHGPEAAADAGGVQA